MGLAISVRSVSQFADHDKLSSALAREGVVWQEPHEVDVPPMRPCFSGFSYSWLHYLRRVLTLVDTQEPVTAIAGRDELDHYSDRIADQASLLSSHLLCHSDSDGYYLPVDFGDPLFLPEDAGVAGGGLVGSSQGLLTELRRCAPALGIRLDPDGALSDDEAARIGQLFDDDADFAIETTVWLTLHEACRASIASGHAIVFH
jgi:hypothetical protein